MAYPQAPAEMPLYMRLPQGYKRNGITRKTHALKLLRNMYGQNHKPGMCGISLWTKVCERWGSNQVNLTLVTITEGLPSSWSTSTIASSLVRVTNPLIKLSQTYVPAPDNSQWMIKATSATFWASKSKNQPQLTDSIIKDLHLQTSSNGKKTPSMMTSLLHKDVEGPEMTPDFHYHNVIGKLNFLEKSTRPDISISMHQCTRFSENPKRSHTEAVNRIG